MWLLVSFLHLTAHSLQNEVLLRTREAGEGCKVAFLYNVRKPAVESIQLPPLRSLPRLKGLCQQPQKCAHKLVNSSIL